MAVVRDSTSAALVFVRYCASSVMAAVIDSVTFYAVFRITGGLVAGQVAGRLLAMSAAFVVARNMVFRSDRSVLRSLIQYVVLVAGMGAISYGMLYYLHVRVGLPALISKLTAEGLLFLAGFSIQHRLIFVRSRNKTPEA